MKDKINDEEEATKNFIENYNNKLEIENAVLKLEREKFLLEIELLENKRMDILILYKSRIHKEIKNNKNNF